MNSPDPKQENSKATVGVEVPEEAKKAYYVEEAFHGWKTQLVFAANADDAKERCRRGEIELCISEDGPHPAGFRSVSREPSEDRR